MTTTLIVRKFGGACFATHRGAIPVERGGGTWVGRAVDAMVSERFSRYDG